MKSFSFVKNKKIWLMAAAAVLLVAMPRNTQKLSADSMPFFSTQTGNNFFPTPTPTPANFGNGFGNNFSLTSNNNFCVGQTPAYTISSSTAFSDQNFNWTSSHNGSINSQSTFSLDQNGFWTASGNTWQSSDVGAWQKTATINNQSQTLTFNVQNCGSSNNGSSGTPGNQGSFSLTSNNNFCVGQIPSYSITSSSAFANQAINWTSSHSGNVNNQTTFTLDSSGSWSAQGNIWQSSDVGAWQKTANINGLAQTLSFNVQNCSGQNSGGFFPTPTPTPANFGNGFGNNFSLTSNNNFCVGQNPLYTINASSALANQTINWTSSHNGSITSQNTFTLDSNGSWTAPGNTWQTSDVGNWQKTASINGLTQTLSFTVQNCGGTNLNNSGLGNSGGNDTIGGSVGSGDQTIGGSVGLGNQTIGGGLGDETQTIGGSVGFGSQTIGGSVGGADSPTIGGSVGFAQ